MKIFVNGAAETVDGPLTLEALIEAKGLDRRFLVVEHNGAPVPREDLATVKLRDGDRLELVRPVAGG